MADDLFAFYPKGKNESAIEADADGDGPDSNRPTWMNPYAWGERADSRAVDLASETVNKLFPQDSAKRDDAYCYIMHKWGVNGYPNAPEGMDKTFSADERKQLDKFLTDNPKAPSTEGAPHWMQQLEREFDRRLGQKQQEKETEKVTKLENGVTLRRTEALDTVEFPWGTKLVYDRNAGSLAVLDNQGKIVPFKKVGETASIPSAQILSYENGGSAYLFEDGRLQFRFAGDTDAAANFDILGVTSISNNHKTTEFRKPTRLPVHIPVIGNQGPIDV